MKEIRTLTANEIECRIGVGNNPDGCSLLLYKDARSDMAILDEVFGAENWQRRHYECKGNLFCSVSVKIGGEWVSKDDCGTESYAEKEKGEASDSFKRACVNWGIGRELYTSPFIWITLAEADRDKNGKVRTKFSVSNIEYNEYRAISRLDVIDGRGNTRFSYDENKSKKSLSEDSVNDVQLRGKLIPWLAQKEEESKGDFSVVELIDKNYKATKEVCIKIEKLYNKSKQQK